MGNGTICYGGAGCGKTYKLCQLASEAEDPIILSFTNKATENVKSVLRKKYRNYELAKKCYTFDLYFCDYHGRDLSALEDKTIFIDEYSMVPNSWMTKVYQAFTKYHNQIYMFGDTNQCDPDETASLISNTWSNISSYRLLLINDSSSLTILTVAALLLRLLSGAILSILCRFISRSTL